MGDHCPCYVDLDSLTLFCGQTYPIVPPAQRGIQLKDPRKIEAYIKALTKQLEYHKIPEKLTELENISNTAQWSDYHTQEYSKIDNIITESMLFAERSITRHRTQNYNWSIELAQAIHTVHY
jgi:hypothetical protein